MAKPSRKEIRLDGWDYASNAAYHVTICTKDKQAILGASTTDTSTPSIQLSALGKHCKVAIEDADRNVLGLKVDLYVIMPNHIHLLLSLNNGCHLGKVITRIKAAATRAAKADGIKESIWQRGYYDHIIRNASDYKTTWDYIESNPAKWENDELYIR